MYRDNTSKRQAEIESAKRTKTDSHSWGQGSWGPGSGSNSQWHQRSAHEDISTDQEVTGYMEKHNKIISKLEPVGEQTTVQPPVTPITPVTLITDKPFLDPEPPAVQQQSLPVLLTGIVSRYGKGIDQNA